jgi:hypothetical protein
MSFNLAERLFIFRPECTFSDFGTQCSSGWILYVLVFSLTVLFYRDFVIPVMVWLAFVLTSLTTNFGLPWYELTYHCAFGGLIAATILFSCEWKSPPFLEQGLCGNALSSAALFFVLFIFLLLFGGLDIQISETRSPYGLAFTLLLVIIWMFVTVMVMFCVRSLDNKPHVVKHFYFRLWLSFFIIVLLAFTVGFLPHANSYVKSYLCFMFSVVLMTVMRWLIYPIKYAIE